MKGDEKTKMEAKTEKEPKKRSLKVSEPVEGADRLLGHPDLQSSCFSV